MHEAMFGEKGLAGTELTMAPAMILLLGPSRIAVYSGIDSMHEICSSNMRTAYSVPGQRHGT